MAKTIATITGTALVPGVSRNGRWYKPEHVAEAVRSAQERIRAGAKPMVMLTFHGADDNSREIAASLTDVSLNENGGADFAAGHALVEERAVLMDVFGRFGIVAGFVGGYGDGR